MIGGYSLGLYLVKFIFPYIMSPLYPYPATLPVDSLYRAVCGDRYSRHVIIAYKKDWRPIVFGILFFIVNVMFVLQIIGAGQGYLADRFTYIPYIGLIFMVICGIQWLLEHKTSYGETSLVWLWCIDGSIYGHDI